MDSRSSTASHRSAVQVALQPEPDRLRLPKLESNLFQDIRLVAEDIGLQTGYVDSLLAKKKPAYSSRWSKYKEWCLEHLFHPFGSGSLSQVNYESMLNQVMAYLGYFKPSCRSFTSFTDTKSMLAWVFKSMFGYAFGTDVRIMQWMKGWQHEKPKSVKFDTDTDGWDVGLIVDYWSRQPPNAELTTVELGYKALSLFAVAVYPRPSDLARLSRDRFQRLSNGVRYRYFGTKELRAVPKFTGQHGLGFEMQRLVCPALALEAYIDRTADKSVYFHSDSVYDFEHVFMSQTPARYGPYNGMHHPVGAQTCSRWMKEVMTRAGITGYSGGSVRMAAASAAIDSGVPIDEVLRTGRWSSWLVFNKFYNRSMLRAVVPLVGRTSLA